MQERFFYHADGELLMTPQFGRLRLTTETGVLELAPMESAPSLVDCAFASAIGAYIAPVYRRGKIAACT
jgi:hypothetical protein